MVRDGNGNTGSAIWHMRFGRTAGFGTVVARKGKQGISFSSQNGVASGAFPRGFRHGAGVKQMWVGRWESLDRQLRLPLRQHPW